MMLDVFILTIRLLLFDVIHEKFRRYGICIVQYYNLCVFVSKRKIIVLQTLVFF